MTTINGLIDPKTRKKALAALDNNDTSMFDKAKPKAAGSVMKLKLRPEEQAAGPVMKLKLTPKEQAKLNSELIELTDSGKGDTHKIRKLLDRGADAKAENEVGRTALMLACGNNNIGVAKLLLDRGADVNASDEEGFTALVVVVDDGYFDIAEFLLSNGADVNAKVNRWGGMTALMFAVDKGDEDREISLEISELLISRGADVNATDDEGKTVLEYAKGKRHNEVIELLKRHGAK